MALKSVNVKRDLPMDKLKQAFLEEAREHLVELESALIELDQNRADLSVVGRAFRALHTIKGSGAMFGFVELAAFTHDIENAFDKLRNGQLQATADLINLSLAAGDQIKTMLDESEGMGTADRKRAAEILTQFSTLTGASPTHSAPATTTAAPVKEDTAAVREWHIFFRPGRDIFLNGTNLLALLAELADLGELRANADTTAIPPLAGLDPQLCYLAWDLTLRTAHAKPLIQDVFTFVEDDSELLIEALEPPPVRMAGSPAATVSQPAANTVDKPSTSLRSSSASSVRVSNEKLDQLINLVGELVTVQARLGGLSARRQDPEITAISEDVDRLALELRENSMSIRMVPLRATFDRFRRLVRDLAIELGKEVELAVEGADTELDKTVIDQLTDPLVHIIRNSMDHGIEKPDVRQSAGKPSCATVRLSAIHSGANVLIRVSDDGRGLDVTAVRARAIERGLIGPDAQLSESEVFSLILSPGFSTAPQITDLSGRGVGMDVVRRNVEALRGSIEIASKPGAGMTVTLRLPLTLAIIDGLLVRIGDEHFVLPLANSLECVELTREERERSNGNRFASVRGEIIPYIRLSEYFGMGHELPDCEQIMVVETDLGRYGFLVDQVLGNHQTVIKNLGRVYRNVQVVSGATILGDGTVALIIDSQRLVQEILQSSSDSARVQRRVTSPRPAPLSP